MLKISVLYLKYKVDPETKFQLCPKMVLASQTDMRMHGSREGVCGNNAVQFQSCDNSSYFTVLGENGCTDVSCQLWGLCSYLHFCTLRSNLQQRSIANCATCMNLTIWSDDGVGQGSSTRGLGRVYHKIQCVMNIEAWVTRHCMTKGK